MGRGREKPSLVIADFSYTFAAEVGVDDDCARVVPLAPRRRSPLHDGERRCRGRGRQRVRLRSLDDVFDDADIIIAGSAAHRRDKQPAH